jgi:hypothetical protein
MYIIDSPFLKNDSWEYIFSHCNLCSFIPSFLETAYYIDPYGTVPPLNPRSSDPHFLLLAKYAIFFSKACFMKHLTILFFPIALCIKFWILGALTPQTFEQILEDLFNFYLLKKVNDDWRRTDGRRTLSDTGNLLGIYPGWLKRTISPRSFLKRSSVMYYRKKGPTENLNICTTTSIDFQFKVN